MNEDNPFYTFYSDNDDDSDNDNTRSTRKISGAVYGKFKSHKRKKQGGKVTASKKSKDTAFVAQARKMLDLLKASSNKTF